MKFFNTIELFPTDFAITEYEYPTKSVIEAPNEWDQFWKKCLAEKGMDQLEPIQTGYNLVDITTINEHELEEIIKHELKDVDIDEYEDEVGRICGGIAIKINNQCLITPNCCGDIGNIRDWEDIFTEGKTTWQMLWIGHPWIFYRRQNGHIEFSDYHEANLEDIDNLKIILTIKEADLKKELILLKKQQIAFEQKIKKVLDKLAINPSDKIAKCMTGNE